MGDPRSGGPLPKASDAAIDPAKFTDYSMNPANAANSGKWEAFAALGYAVDDASGRAAGAQNVIAQLREQVITAPATEGKVSPYGRRFELRTRLRGPNGALGILVTVWQIDVGSEIPRLITNWLVVYRQREVSSEGASL